MPYFFLLRIHHWSKNAFVFIPAFFAGVLTNWSIIGLLVQGFFCFSFIASAVYIINDYRDRESDRLHPTKKNRPLASNSVQGPVALVIMFVLCAAGLIWGASLSTTFGVSLLIYLLVNILYSMGLKKYSHPRHLDRILRVPHPHTGRRMVSRCFYFRMARDYGVPALLLPGHGQEARRPGPLPGGTGTHPRFLPAIHH